MARRDPLGWTAAAALIVSVLAFCGVIALTVLPVHSGAGASAAYPRPSTAGGGAAGGGAAGGAPASGRPLIIAHRGASGYLPEETLAADDLAIRQDADYIEADLVSTKDGVLIARHENELSATTDVGQHPEFADLRRTELVDGQRRTGWFTEDFTLAQIKTLRAVERRPGRGAPAVAYDGRSTVATLQEVIDLARVGGQRRHRPVGLYLETKSPDHFASIGLALESPLVRLLRRNHLDQAGSPVFLESFDPASLRLLHSEVDLPLIQLIAAGAGGTAESANDATGPAAGATPAPAITPAALTAISGYAIGIGIDRAELAGRLRTGTATAVAAPAADRDPVTLAHQAGLVVHVFTFAPQTAPTSLPAAYHRAGDPPDRADALAEYRAYFELGVDGVFTDTPDVAGVARSSIPAG